MVGHAQGMFIGETLCLLAFKVGLLCAVAKRPVSGRPDSFSPFIFALPALCDCLATSTMYLGLTMTVLFSKKISAARDGPVRYAHTYVWSQWSSFFLQKKKIKIT